MEKRKYSIKNLVMFGIIMKNPEFCIGLLERIFPGRKVKELRFVYAADEDEEQLVQIEKLRKYFAQNRPDAEKSIIVDAAVAEASLRKEVRRKVTLYDEMQMMRTLLKEAEERLENQKLEIDKLESKRIALEASQAELEASKAELEASKAELEASKTELEASKAQFDRMNRLNVRLAKLGRTDDIMKAAADEIYCRQLMNEMGIE